MSQGEAAEQKSGSLIDDAMATLRTAVAYVKSIPWSEVVANRAFAPAAIAVLAFFVAFSGLFKYTIQQWLANDYYSHGFLVPVLIGWQLHARRDLFLKSSPKPTWVPLALLLPVIVLTYFSIVGQFWAFQSICLIGLLATITWLIVGLRWALLALVSIAFMAFALPIWDSLIDNTNPLQVLSTTIAENLLKLFGLSPMRIDPTVIQLNSYALNVEVPCSGLKLLIAVSCFTMHFILIARSTISFNFLMAALVLPLCLFINGLRISLIGVVGDTQGSDAALKFHDYSGYITLLLCFYVLFKFARMFGWKG